MNVSDNRNRYLPALTGVRAIAAFMVCLFHSNPFSEVRAGTIVHNFFNEFHVGVTFFFVLSGFLIAYRYYDETKIDFKKYFVNRFARIYPVYFLLTTAYIFGMMVWQQKDLANTLLEYGLNISLSRGFFDDYKFSGILQGWSLTVEETFYLLAPFSFLAIKRFRASIVLLPAAFVAFGFGLVFLLQNNSLWGFFDNIEFMISFTFFGRAFEFFIGIGLALFFKKYELSKLNSKPIFTYLGMFVVVVLIFWLSLCKGNQDYGIRTPMGKIINNLLLPLLGIAVFYWGLLTESSYVSRFFSSKPMIVLGKSSYACYLIHLYVISINKNFLFVFIVSNLAAILVFYLVEEPLNKKIRTMYQQKYPRIVAG